MLRKRRVALGALEVTVEGFQADEPPWAYQRVALHFLVRCDGVSAGVLERVIRLSVVRYCSVVATLRGVAKIEATVELVTADGATTGRRPVRLDVVVAEPLDDPAEGETAGDPVTDEG